MKKLFIIAVLAICFTSVHAQFKTAVLQASGLTCAMCSRAINNSLEKLPSIQSVKADIKNSAFNITFKPGVSLNIDQLKKAVQDAGFAIAKLKLTGDFTNVPVKNDEHIKINGSTFHFLNVHDQTLNGSRDIIIVDKNYLTAREFRKFSAATEMTCVQTGKAAGCCKKEGLSENTRIYHATI